MALGPGVIGEKRKAAVRQAEARIDEAIRNSDGGRVTVAVSLLGVSTAEWDGSLRPKYLAAGWKTAEWCYDQRDGDFIDLQ